MLLVFPSQKVLSWFSAGAKPPSGAGGFTPTDSPANSPEDPPILPIDSAIEPKSDRPARSNSPFAISDLRWSTLKVLVFWEVAEGEEITLCRRLS